MTAILSRRYETDQTFGKLVLFDKDNVLLICDTLELKWMGNIKNLSCIPEGDYKVTKIIRPDGRNGLHILNVPKRDAILIHTGNYASGSHVDVQGCILVGDGFKDINGDGHLDIVNSTKTFDTLFNLLSSDFRLIIL